MNKNKLLLGFYLFIFIAITVLMILVVKHVIHSHITDRKPLYRFIGLAIGLCLDGLVLIEISRVLKASVENQVTKQAKILRVVAKLLKWTGLILMPLALIALIVLLIIIAVSNGDSPLDLAADIYTPGSGQRKDAGGRKM